MTTREPIRIRCEGSSLPGHEVICPSTHGMCVMCGGVKLLDADGNISEHERDDILAQLDRGDYG